MGKQQSKLPSLEDLGITNKSDNKLPTLEDLGLGKSAEGSTQGLENTSQTSGTPFTTSQGEFIPTPLTRKGGDLYLQEQLQPKIRRTQPTLGKDYLGNKAGESKIEKGIAEQFLPFAPKNLGVGEFNPDLEGIGAPLLPSNQELSKSEKTQADREQKVADKLSAELGIAKGAYDETQGLGSTQRIEDAIKALPISTIRDSTNDDSKFTKSAKRSFNNLATSLQGVMPRATLLSSVLLEKVLGRENAKAYIDALNYDPFTGESDLGKDYNTAQREALEQLDYLSTQTLRTEGISENIRDFSAQGLAAAAVDSITSLASTIIPSALSGGTLLASEMIGAGLYDANKVKAELRGVTIEELFAKGDMDVSVPVLLGSISFGLEKIGLKGINNLINKKITGSLYKKALIITSDINKEGLTEFVQAGLDAANIALAQGLSIEEASEAALDTMFSDQGFETYAKGALGATLAGGVGRIGKTLVKSNTKKVADLVDRKTQAFTDLVNTTTPSAVKPMIIDTIADAQEKINKLVDEDIDKTENLTEEQKVRLVEINSEIDAMETALLNVSETVKATVEEKIKQLNAEIDKITTTNEVEVVAEERILEINTIIDRNNVSLSDKTLVGDTRAIVELQNEQLQEELNTIQANEGQADTGTTGTTETGTTTGEGNQTVDIPTLQTEGTESVGTELEQEIKKVGKPNVKLNLIANKDLVNSKNALESRKAHNEVKENYKKLKELMDCLWN